MEVTAFLKGMGLGGGLIVAIGSQNAYLLRQALKKEYVLTCIAICIICDVVLIGAGVVFYQLPGQVFGLFPRSDLAAETGGNCTLTRPGETVDVKGVLVHGAGLAPFAGRRARAVVSNPPYIAYEEGSELPAMVRDWEPSVALFSGPTGMDATVRLVREAAAVLEPGGLLAMEVDTRRAALVAECVAADGRYGDVGVRLDLTGRERFVLARRLHPEESA